MNLLRGTYRTMLVLRPASQEPVVTDRVLVDGDDAPLADGDDQVMTTPHADYEEVAN